MRNYNLRGSRNASPYFLLGECRMKFNEFSFVFISLDYLRQMHRVDSEVFFVDNESYKNKPYLGVLINNNNTKYVIPLTSAKDKHKTWSDVTATNYIIYEIINVEKTKVDEDDVITEIKNKKLLQDKGIPASEYYKYKKRILSVLEIKKMIPIKEGVYTYANLNKEQGLDKDELQRRGLMYKEYRFCLKIKDKVQEKAKKDI